MNSGVQIEALREGRLQIGFINSPVRIIRISVVGRCPDQASMSQLGHYVGIWRTSRRSRALAVSGPHFEKHRLRRMPLILDGGDFIDLIIELELPRPLVGFETGIRIDADGEGHAANFTGEQWFRASGNVHLAMNEFSCGA